mmetsp:Transcript_20946/g.65401  ORF Transcript_20946/g.65401 Transcript_20946/m.65401 type:complete len:487 (+) Transcript_20946:20-1480(+)
MGRTRTDREGASASPAGADACGSAGSVSLPPLRPAGGSVLRRRAAFQVQGDGHGRPLRVAQGPLQLQQRHRLRAPDVPQPLSPGQAEVQLEGGGAQAQVLRLQLLHALFQNLHALAVFVVLAHLGLPQVVVPALDHAPVIPFLDGDLQQLAVGALLHDAALVHDEDPVALLDRGEAVCDHDGATCLVVLDHLVQGCLHHALSLGVQGARGLVQQHDRGLADDGAGDGQALLLAAAELRPALTDLRRVALWQRAYEAISVGGPGSFLALLLRGALAAIGDVLADAAGEEHGLLLHQGHLPSQPRKVQAADVVAVQEHRAGVGVVEALQQGYDRAFAGAAGAAEGYSGAGLDLQVKVCEDRNIWTRRVSKGHVGELDLPRDGCKLVTAFVICVDCRGAVERAEDVVHGRLGLGLVCLPLGSQGRAGGRKQEGEEDLQHISGVNPAVADENVGDEDDAPKHQERDARVVGTGKGRGIGLLAGKGPFRAK